jgi:hypothetical protein
MQTSPSPKKSLDYSAFPSPSPVPDPDAEPINKQDNGPAPSPVLCPPSPEVRVMDSSKPNDEKDDIIVISEDDTEYPATNPFPNPTTKEMLDFVDQLSPINPVYHTPKQERHSAVRTRPLSAPHKPRRTPEEIYKAAVAMLNTLEKNNLKERTLLEASFVTARQKLWDTQERNRKALLQSIRMDGVLVDGNGKITMNKTQFARKSKVSGKVYLTPVHEEQSLPVTIPIKKRKPRNTRSNYCPLPIIKPLPINNT